MKVEHGVYMTADGLGWLGCFVETRSRFLPIYKENRPALPIVKF